MYQELGVGDWAAVIQVLREQNLLEEVGGLVLLDEVWRREGLPSALDFYIELLRDYAIQRGINPYEPVFHFTGGRVQLEPNRAWHRAGDPEYVGAARVAGLFYRARGWGQSDHKVEVKLYPRR